MRLVSASGTIHPPLGPLALTARWQRLNFAVQPGRYRLEATRTGPGWFAFTAPVATSRASRFAQQLPSFATWFAIAGAACAGLGIVLQIRFPGAR